MDSKFEQWSQKAIAMAKRSNEECESNDGIDESIVLGREALELYPPGHPIRPGSLHWLAGYLHDRYKLLGTAVDLNEAIDLEREALELWPANDVERSGSLMALARYLSASHGRWGKIADLEEAIVLRREALSDFPPGHPNRPGTLGNQAADLCTRFEQLEDLDDLESAIAHARESLALRRQLDDDEDRCVSWILLASHLHARYNELGKMEDLDEAITVGRECLTICPPDHSERALAFINLASSLITRYKKLGETEYLGEAISLARESLDKYKPGDARRFISSNNLALFFIYRYNRLGAVADLDEAIVLAREALALCSRVDQRSMCLGNLANHLEKRYRRLNERENLDEAITLDREALGLRPPDSRDQSSTGSLAAHLYRRYVQLGTAEDLEEAIQLDHDILVLRPPEHPDRSTALFYLAHHLFERFQLIGDMEDLNEAIQLDREVLALRPPHHLERPYSLRNLAIHLSIQFKQFSQLTDREEMLNLYSELANGPKAVMASFSDLTAVEVWIQAAEDVQHSTTHLAYETALGCLDQSPSDRPYSLEKRASLGADAFSAYLRHSLRARAVEFLEQARGLVWNHLSHLRSPLDDVVASGQTGKMLADKFTELASAVFDPIDSSDADQCDDELETVITQIRDLPGLSHFLLPSSFAELQQAASEGPVVIMNASKYGCDILIVLPDREPLHVPLKITQERVRKLSLEFGTLSGRAERVDITDELTSSLQALWNEVVSPVAESLQTVHPHGSRIWWCPTAEFTTLPLHAAGPHTEGKQNFSDLYISSYTPTLTALIRARRAMPSISTPEQVRFLSVGNIREHRVRYVGTELDLLSQRLEHRATVTRLEAGECTIARVVDELGKHGWVHLACPDRANRRRPFESALMLDDGPLTIQRLIGCKLEDPRVVFMSAGNPVFGTVDEHVDGGVDLASAMLFAGFRSVVGRLWAVREEGETETETESGEEQEDGDNGEDGGEEDEEGKEEENESGNEGDSDGDSEWGRMDAIVLGHVFYSRVVNEDDQLDHTRAAYAVHEMMTNVVDIPLHWRISYVHLGI